MSQKPYRRSPQRKILTRIGHMQNHIPSREAQIDPNGRIPHRSPTRQNEEPNSNLRKSESYDIIRYDNEIPGSASEEVYFDELYGQENVALNATHPFERNAGGKLASVRSRSLPPTNSERKDRLAASFPQDNDHNSQPHAVGNDNINEYVQNEILSHSPRHANANNEFEQSRNQSPSNFKKVSYAQIIRREKPGSSTNISCSPIQCGFHTDSAEADSDLSLPTTAPIGRKNGRAQPTNHNRIMQELQSTSPQTISDRSFMYEGQSLEDFENKNYKVSKRYSQDSFVGFGPGPPNVYRKDVLPLPIEIPDNVDDAEAFRRYLSVRRGAITPVRKSFEKRNQSCPSYDSIGRRPRMQTMGLTANGQLGQEASRRTSSLSHAIITLALLSASICQLRFLITYSHAHSYPILNYFLVSTSIVLEVAAGIGYVLIARCSYNDVQAESIHNYLIFALFIVAVSNVILAALAFDSHICEELSAKHGHTSAFSSITSQQDQQFSQPTQQQKDDKVMDLKYLPLE